MLQLRDKILNFRQLYEEILYKLWERFNRKLTQCPNNEVVEKMLLQILYRALDSLNKIVVENTTRGFIMTLHYHVMMNFIKRATNKNWGCYNQDVEVPKGSTTISFFDKEKRK